MLFLYQIFFSIFILPVLLLNKKTRAGLNQRFGRYDFKNKKQTLWIHAVSVGEILALSDFIKSVQGYDIVLTTSTEQGFEVANLKLKDTCKQIVYFPYDLPLFVNRAIKAINPKLVFVMETEIWPNFINTLNKAEIPVLIINGRISERTFKSYKCLKFFFKPILSKFAAILAQSQTDAERFIQIGANPVSTKVMGNIKFDIKAPDVSYLDLGLSELEPGPLFIAGSTHKGEDEVVLDAFLEAKKTVHNLKLLLAPRHMERLEQVESLVVARGLGFELRTSGKNFKDTDVIILNTTGELAALYSQAKVVFMGGSFNNTGGHNPLEAAIWNKPVISGPSVKNFRHIYSELCEFNCAKIVKTPPELTCELIKILTDKAVLCSMISNCEKVFEKNSGAKKYLLNLLEVLRK